MDSNFIRVSDLGSM